MMLLSALPVSVSAPGDPDSIKTMQEPYSYVRYYNDSTEIAAYKYYYTQEVDVKFDIIPADPNRIFVGWSTSEFGPAKYYTDFNTGDRLDEIGGSRRFIMGGEDINLYAVWLDESLVEKIGTHGTTSYTIKPDIKGVIISKPPSNGINY